MSKEEQEISLQYKGKDKPEDAAKCAERKMLDRKSMPLSTQGTRFHFWLGNRSLGHSTQG